MGTEAGKKRPVIIIQTNLLNSVNHPSTLICPLTTNVQKNAQILRVCLPKDTASLTKECDIMVDQLRAIDNKRLVKKIGKVPSSISSKLKENLLIIMDIG
ncbi:type II toxin-antitoxin system PemK/MazF family toxin [Salegentibacter sp. JZCK2]|uniref:type II toxin-antitoxin system PemK/MazF family toxin n=1 Tax=Salegentibacter tibetensis TaxID=2873600 RepID=UPI001CCD03ED|nr:type II toxin-antitoxin system PemK/MazF family toxin [Salegentibacter tibetensis]